MKIGFVGLGHMGPGMAANLLKAGHNITVNNRTPGKTQTLVDLGAQAFAQVSEVCRGEAVITMLANDDAVESVVFGAQGILPSLSKGGAYFIGKIPEELYPLKLMHSQKVIDAPTFSRRNVLSPFRIGNLPFLIRSFRMRNYLISLRLQMKGTK